MATQKYEIIYFSYALMHFQKFQKQEYLLTLSLPQTVPVKPKERTYTF